MAQVLKDEVRARVRTAALETFAERGYPGATMAAVAARAGVATGNLYRYYRSKAELFDDVITDEFVEEFERVVGRRVRYFGSLAGDDAGPDAAEEMMDFWLAHRLEAVVALAGADGTRHADVSRRLVDLSVGALVDSLPPGAVSDADRGLLDTLFVHTGRAIALILERNESEAAIRSTIANFWRYQLAGLTALLRHLDEQAAAATPAA